MAKYGSANIGFWLVGGYNLLASDIFDATFTTEGVTEESTSLGDAWTEHLPVGVRRAEFQQNGLYDDAALSINAAMIGNETTSRVACITLEGNTIGKRFIGMNGTLVAKHQRIGTRAGLHRMNITYTVTGAIDNFRSIILQNLTTKTAAWNTEGADSVNHGASTADGGAGYLQVTALVLDGITTFQPTIRHSADDVTYANLLAFTAFSAAPYAERKTVTGTVNQHLAVAENMTGAGASSSITLMIGFDRSHA